MKFAGVAQQGAVKGWFGVEDGSHIVLDFTQGRHGRAFCGDQCYDLPDPRAQLVTVSNPGSALEIISVHGNPSQMGSVEVASLKITGDVRMPVARAKRFELSHSWLSANEISGPKDRMEEEAQTIQDIVMRDSRITSQGELNFANLLADDHSESFVQAAYLEGMTAQGRLSITADSLMVGVLEAQEVQVGRADGCHVAQIYCDRVLQRLGLGRTVPTRPVYDKDLMWFIHSLTSINLPALEEHGAGIDL
jgi:hypothetical protein